MRRGRASMIFALLITMSFAGLSPSMAEGSNVIGSYRHIVMTRDLTVEHTSWAGERLIIEAPQGTNILEINLSFLEHTIGPWATTAEFSVNNGRAVFKDSRVSIQPLELGPRAFTQGHETKILFFDRPMWISVDQEDYGGPISLEMSDGDSNGQSIFVSKDWLHSRGLHRPEAIHEDGSILNVTPAETGFGWILEIPHFSVIKINPPDLTVKGQMNGLTFPHLDERRWDSDAKRLEIDVSDYSADYNVLVEREWIDFRLNPVLFSNQTWSVTEEGGEEYYIASLSSHELPTTLHIRQNLWSSYEFPLNFTEFAANITLDKPVKLPMTAESSIEIDLIRSVPWNVTATTMNGTEHGTFWNLTGGPLATEQGYSISFTETPTGFIGEIRLDSTGAMYHYRPMNEPSTYQVGGTQTGCWYRVHGTIFIPISGECSSEPPPPSHPEGYPHTPPYNPYPVDITPSMYLEATFCMVYGDCWIAAAHAYNSVYAGQPMWDKYVGVELQYPPEYNFISDLPGSDCYDRWWEFLEIQPDGDVSLLFTSSNFGSEFGCIIRNSIPATQADHPYTVNVARDEPVQNYFGASNPTHLGLVVAHEIGHAWGETAHRCDEVYGKKSFMCDDNDYSNKQFWLHYGTDGMDCEQSTERIIVGLRGLTLCDD